MQYCSKINAMLCILMCVHMYSVYSVCVLEKYNMHNFAFHLSTTNVYNDINNLILHINEDIVL